MKSSNQANQGKKVGGYALPDDEDEDEDGQPYHPNVVDDDED